MDDIKLYASKKNHILSLLTITENFSNDIGMSFGIDKCKTQSIYRGHYENLEFITKEGEIIKNLNKGEFYKYLGINQSNHIQHSIIKENLEKQFYLRIKSILKSKLNGNNLIKAVNTYTGRSYSDECSVVVAWVLGCSLCNGCCVVIVFCVSFSFWQGF
jgi:hypothetical protein